MFSPSYFVDRSLQMHRSLFSSQSRRHLAQSQRVEAKNRTEEWHVCDEIIYYIYYATVTQSHTRIYKRAVSVTHSLLITRLCKLPSERSARARAAVYSAYTPAYQLEAQCACAVDPPTSTAESATLELVPLFRPSHSRSISLFQQLRARNTNLLCCVYKTGCRKRRSK